MSFKHDVFSVYRNKNLISSAEACEIMGGPLESLRWLTNFLSSNGEVLKRGSLVIPGSPTELIEVNHDCNIDVAIGNVGQVSAIFTS